MSIHLKYNNGAWSIIGEVMMGNTRKYTIHNIYYDWYMFISKVDCIRMQFILFSYCRITWYPYTYISTTVDYFLRSMIFWLLYDKPWEEVFFYKTWSQVICYKFITRISWFFILLAFFNSNLFLHITDTHSKTETL